MAYDYEYFKKAVYDLTKINLDAYKEKQMKRRIDTLIAKNKIVGYDKYVAALKENNRMFEEFVNYLTINVSEFYRNPDQWQMAHIIDAVNSNCIENTPPAFGQYPRFQASLPSDLVLPERFHPSHCNLRILFHGIIRSRPARSSKPYERLSAALRIMIES